MSIFTSHMKERTKLRVRKRGMKGSKKILEKKIIHGKMTYEN